MPSKYTGEDALAYQDGPADPAGPVNYVQKRLQKRKGVEVVFDPKGHKDYLTGFRLRKQQRRKAAAKQIEKKERQAKLEERAERRKALRDKLKLDQYESDPETINRHEAEQAQPRETIVHDDGQYKSVVTVEALDWNDNREATAQEASSSADDNESPKAAPLHGYMSQAATAGAAPNNKAPKPGKKLKPAAIMRKKQKHEGRNKKKKPKKKGKAG